MMMNKGILENILEMIEYLNANCPPYGLVRVNALLKETRTLIGIEELSEDRKRGDW